MEDDDRDRSPHGDREVNRVVLLEAIALHPRCCELQSGIHQWLDRQ